MRKLLLLFAPLLCSLVLFLLLLTISNTMENRIMKKRIYTLLSQNISLTSKFESYKDQTKNLRQIVISSNTPDAKNTHIGNIINQTLNRMDGDVSLYYKNLTTGESVIVDGAHTYYMASLYKVIVTLYILEAEKAGKLSLSDTIGTPPITLKLALNKIITESNNEYAQAIAEKYGWKKIEQFITAELGISFSFNEDLTTTVTDMGSLFESISKAINISDTESNTLLDLLHRQTKTNKLPKYLPKHIYIHNKTGEFENYSHDAGIFYTPKANYILIYMSKTPNPGTTDETMAKISEKIYNILNDVPNQ